MEDVLLFEEIQMIPDTRGRRYLSRRNIFEYDTDRDFVPFIDVEKNI